MKKKNRSMRKCIDYKIFNRVTLKNKYHIPHIVDLFDQLSSAVLFSKNNLRSRHHQMRIKVEYV